MAYRLRKGDASVEKAVRRIALEQLDREIAKISSDEDRAEVVHDVRLCCKKLRGLVRLIRPVFGGYETENAAFRDTARLLSGSRDAKVLHDTFEMLVEHYANEVDSFVLASIREGLDALGALDDVAADPVAPLEQARERLIAARERAAHWQLDEGGWRALGPGLAKTYGRACKAARTARDEGDAVAYHELRKRLKYHWYHTRLLKPLWPEVMEVRAVVGRRISELLGVHHDLCVFEERVAGNSRVFASGLDAEVVTSLARRRKQELEAQAWPLIGRMLAQSPKALEEYWGALWTVWREAGGHAADAAVNG